MGNFEKSFDNAQDKFYNKALRFLAYRPRSEKEVRDHLVRHSGEEERRLQNLLAAEKNGRDSGHGQNDDRDSIIDKVINKLKEKKFINDEEFTRWWIESRLRFRPKSLRLIKLELRQKGIPDEVIESRITNQESGISSEFEQAKKLIEKRIERFRGLPKRDVYQKLGSYLARRGFDWETIKQSIDYVQSHERS